MTIRQMMTVVAVIAVIVWGGLWNVRMRRLSHVYEVRAEFNEGLEHSWRRLAEHWGAMVHAKDFDLVLAAASPGKNTPVRLRTISEPDRLRLEASQRNLAAESHPRAEKAARLAAHYASLRRKYEHAAKYPWISVAPDPPAPE